MSHLPCHLVPSSYTNEPMPEKCTTSERNFWEKKKIIVAGHNFKKPHADFFFLFLNDVTTSLGLEVSQIFLVYFSHWKYVWKLSAQCRPSLVVEILCRLLKKKSVYSFSRDPQSLVFQTEFENKGRAHQLSSLQDPLRMWSIILVLFVVCQPVADLHALYVFPASMYCSRKLLVRFPAAQTWNNIIHPETILLRHCLTYLLRHIPG